MYILADMNRNCRKKKIYIGTKTTFEKIQNQKIVFFNKKDFIFYKYICKMYISADMKWNCKNSRFIYEQDWKNI